MKRIIMAVGVLAALAFTQQSQAQLRVGININIGDQPTWRPAGYDYAEYYYLPDIETYYYVPQRQFIYLSNGRWMFSTSLPSRYSSYDLYGGRKVVINRHNAYRYFDQDRVRYGRGNYYSRNDGYRHDNGRHRGWYKKNKNKRYRY